MAKVASTSIYHSIESQTDIPVYHIHTLSEKLNVKAVQDCRDHGLIPASRPVGSLIYNYKIKKQKPLKIITCVREPIDRNISAFFEAFEFYLGIPPNKWTGSMEQLSEEFYNSLPQDFPLEWYDKEFFKMTSIDLFKEQFDKNKKYKVYKKENIDILLLRTDLSNDIMAEQIKHFLDVSSFTLKSHNVGNKKPYADLYNNFKSQIVFKKEYLIKMLESRYTKHFYSENEISTMYAKYSTKD